MYVCPLCPKKFQTCSAQRHHTNSHGSETALLCEVCGFCTKHVASMSVHKQSHFGKRLKCTYQGCTYAAIHRNRLEDHLSAHRGIKNHVCTVCGKAFAGRKHLQRHEKIHTDPSKYTCSECNYFTARSDKFREHVQKRHQKNDEKSVEQVDSGEVTAGKGRSDTLTSKDSVLRTLSNSDIINLLCVRDELLDCQK